MHTGKLKGYKVYLYMYMYNVYYYYTLELLIICKYCSSWEFVWTERGIAHHDRPLLSLNPRQWLGEPVNPS
jgi:hypothetical protein